MEYVDTIPDVYNRIRAVYGDQVYLFTKPVSEEVDVPDITDAARHEVIDRGLEGALSLVVEDPDDPVYQTALRLLGSDNPSDLIRDMQREHRDAISASVETQGSSD